MTSRNPEGKFESEKQRRDRNLNELLQELRVVGIGVQVLFGFLLSLPFSFRFNHLDEHQRWLYLGSVLLSVAAIALLVSPAAFHRIHYNKGKKAQLLKVSNRLTIMGIGAVGLAITSVVWLISSVVMPGIAVPVLTGGVAALFLILWLAIPFSVD